MLFGRFCIIVFEQNSDRWCIGVAKLALPARADEHDQKKDRQSKAEADQKYHDFHGSKVSLPHFQEYDQHQNKN